MRYLSLTILLWKLLTLSCFAQIETRPVPNLIDSSVNGFSVLDSLKINSTAADSLVENNSDSIDFEFSIMDSLDKYSAADSFFKAYDNGNMLSIGKVNKTFFAAYFIYSNENWDEDINAAKDSLIFFHKKQGGKWFQTDKFSSSNSIYNNFEKKDLNGDGFADLVFPFFAPQNTENMVFIFNKKTRQFYHNEQFDLENISYDPKNKFVKSYHYSGIVDCQYKMRYRVVGENLKFDLGVTACPDDHLFGEKASILRYNTIKNGKEITIKSIKGSGKKIGKLFRKALWDSSLDDN
jgi:hypothetical protein